MILYILNKCKFFIYIIILLCYITADQISRLEQENAALVIQIREVTAQQIDRDRMLDEFGVAIDVRMSEWKV